MPLITVKVFKDELTPAQSAKVIEKMTDAFCSVTSEKLRDATWIQIEEINDGQWGIGGNALCLDDVKKMIAED
jgi:4-oxalocrotonate tautomerase